MIKFNITVSNAARLFVDNTVPRCDSARVSAVLVDCILRMNGEIGILFKNIQLKSLFIFIELYSF